MEDDGYEVICILQDHIKRIRSAYNFNGDLRLELGAVVNELKILAQLKEIAIVSVSHLNRDASKTIDNTVKGNKADLTRFLGRSNVGESMLMIDNADCVIIVNNEYDQEGNKYMIFYNIKIRNAGLLRDYICHPFENGTKLVEDYYTEPQFLETLVPQNQIPVNTTTMNGVAIKQSSYTNIQALDMDDNLFEPLSGSKYSSNNSKEEDILHTGIDFSSNIAINSEGIKIPIGSLRTGEEPKMQLVVFD